MKLHTILSAQATQNKSVWQWAVCLSAGGVFVSLVNVKWFQTLNWTAMVGSGEQKQKWCWPLWRWKWARQRMIERLGSLLCYWHTGQWLPVVLISSTLYQNKHLKLEENTQKDSLKPCQARNSHRSRKFLKWVLWTRRVKDFLLPELLRSATHSKLKINNPRTLHLWVHCVISALPL